MNGCQGTPWSEEHDGKELHGALGGDGDLEPRESAVFCNRLSPTARGSLSYDSERMSGNAMERGG